METGTSSIAPKEAGQIDRLTSQLIDVNSHLARIVDNLEAVTSRLNGSTPPQEEATAPNDPPGELGTLQGYINKAGELATKLDGLVVTLGKL